MHAAGVMFFLGILLSVEALNAAGLLELLAVDLNKVADTNVIAVAIGLASAVIDNVRCCCLRCVLGPGNTTQTWGQHARLLNVQDRPTDRSCVFACLCV